MEKKTIAIGNPVSVRGLTLIPVIQVSLNSWRGRRGASYFGIKQPMAVVIASPAVNKAFRITGEEFSIDQLRQEVPELTDMLQASAAAERVPPLSKSTGLRRPPDRPKVQPLSEEKMERKTRFELATSSLARRRSSH